MKAFKCWGVFASCGGSDESLLAVHVSAPGAYSAAERTSRVQPSLNVSVGRVVVLPDLEIEDYAADLHIKRGGES